MNNLKGPNKRQLIVGAAVLAGCVASCSILHTLCLSPDTNSGAQEIAKKLVQLRSSRSGIVPVEVRNRLLLSLRGGSTGRMVGVIATQ